MIYVLLTSSIVMCFFVAMLTYYSYAHWIYKLKALPLAIFVVIFGILILLEERGKPLEQYPEGEFNLVHNIIEKDEKENPWIYFWAYTKSDGHKLYKIPYDRETAKKLEEIQAEQEKGSPVSGVFTENTNENGRPELQIEHETGELENRNEIKNYQVEH